MSGISNFEFLEKYDEQIFSMAKTAENMYRMAMYEPIGNQIRKILEIIVSDIYSTLNFNPPSERSLYNFMSCPDFCDYFNYQVKNGDTYLNKMHFIRMTGNKMSHSCMDLESARQNAARLLFDIFKINLWWFSYKYKISEKIIFRSGIYQNEDLHNNYPTKIISKFNKCSENIDVSSDNEIDNDFLPHFDHLIDAYGNFDLNNDQLDAVYKLEHFLNNPECNVFILNGKAGSGKTFLVSGLINYLTSKNIGYKIAAPTGKAAKNIAQKTQSAAYTIHKVIYKYDPNKPLTNVNNSKYDSDDLNESVLHLEMVLRDNEDALNTVYIFDEASMISDTESEESKNGELHFGSGRLLKDLMQYAGYRKILFIGDGAQLLPINYEGKLLPPALDYMYLKSNYPQHCQVIETATLNTIVRQKADSPILNLASQVRLCLQKKQFSLIYDFDNKDIIHIKPGSPILDNICNVYKQNLTGTIVITYTNHQAYEYNKAIRNKLLGYQEYDNNPKLVAGDKVIVTKNNYYYEYFLMNGSIGYIISIDPHYETRTVYFKRKKRDYPNEKEVIKVELTYADAVIVFPENDEDHQISVKLLLNSLDSDDGTLPRDVLIAQHIEVQQRCKEIRNAEEKRKFINHDEYFNAIIFKYAYAITCHKSQGSEWSNVFVQCNGYSERGYEYRSDAYFRWFYTAITRSCDKLFLIKPLILA